MAKTKQKTQEISLSKSTISMDPANHYKTQSSAYDRLLDNGPLTDRKIAKYRKLGYFSNGIFDPRLRLKAEVQQKRQTESRKKARERLLKEYQ
jgi:hypothetical protein